MIRSTINILQLVFTYFIISLKNFKKIAIKILKTVTVLRKTIRTYLHEHNFKHSFQDFINPICRYGTDLESCLHFFLLYTLIQNERRIILSTVTNTGSNLLDKCDFCLTQIFLFDDTFLDVNTNSSILNATIDFVISSKRFEEQLF